MSKGSAVGFFIVLVAFGFCWWGLKEVLDIFCADVMSDMAVTLGLSSQELAWWAFFPLLLFFVILVGMTVRFLRKRQG